MAPMVAVTEAQSGQRPQEMLADNGYGSEKSLGQKHGERRVCPRGPLPRDATRVERMKRKLQTKVGDAIYAARKAIVEPVFGQVKQARGFRGFSLRGLTKVKAEWARVCAKHNILKLYRGC